MTRVLMDGLSNRYGGGRRYVDSMLNALRPYTDSGEIELHVALPDASNGIRVEETSGVNTTVIRGVDSLPARLFWMQTRMHKVAREMKADVIFAPGNIGPLRRLTPMVLSLQVTPEAAAFARDNFKQRLWWAGMTEASRRSAHAAVRVITVSHHLRNWVLKHWDLAADKVVAIPYGVGEPFVGVRAPAPQTEKPFILYAGDFQPHKNLVRLIDAFAVIAGRHAGVDLVFAGDQSGALFSAVNERIAHHRLESRVRMLGRVTPDKLADLYRAAQVVVMPSLAESFGLPLVEAMASGAAVASANIPSLHEVGEDATIFFDPLDIGQMSSAIEQLLSDRVLRERLRQAGPQRAAQYSWSSAARETVKAFHVAAGQ